MFKPLHKAIAILLTAVLCFSGSNTLCYADEISAETHVRISNDDLAAIKKGVGSILDAPEDFGFGDLDFSRLTIGTSIPVYEYKDNAVQLNSFRMYPLFIQSELVAFAVVSASTYGDISAQIYRNIADDVNSTGARISDAVYFIYDSDGFNIVYNGQKHLLSPILDNQFEDKYSATQDNQEVCPVVLGMNLAPLDCSEMYTARSANSNYVYVSVPLKSQYPSTYKNLCWAASVACIGQTLTGTNKSAADVAKAYKGSNYQQAAYCSEARAALKNIYSVTYTHYPSKPSESRMNTNISDGYPIYGQFQGNVTHAVVIYGINMVSGFISVMDPYTNTKIAVYSKYDSGQGQWSYGYANPYDQNDVIYLREHICKEI